MAEFFRTIFRIRGSTFNRNVIARSLATNAVSILSWYVWHEIAYYKREDKIAIEGSVILEPLYVLVGALTAS